MTPKAIIVPAGLRFADLKLEREPGTKRLLFRPEALIELMRENDFDQQTFFREEDLIAWLIAEWYLAHRNAGGDPDPVADEILNEVGGALTSEIPSVWLSGHRVH